MEMAGPASIAGAGMASMAGAAGASGAGVAAASSTAGFFWEELQLRVRVVIRISRNFMESFYPRSRRPCNRPSNGES
jgi:hypothetical protein